MHRTARHACALAGATLLLVTHPVLAARPAIRTGGPSFAGDAKRAIVLSKRSLAGRPFPVLDAAGTVVLEGTLARATGSAKPWRGAAVADLSAITTPGSYRITTGRLESPSWEVTGDGSATSAPVRHILRFFAVNSDGFEPS